MGYLEAPTGRPGELFVRVSLRTLMGPLTCWWSQNTIPKIFLAVDHVTRRPCMLDDMRGQCVNDQTEASDSHLYLEALYSLPLSSDTSEVLG